ncbi:MAG: DUF655 domain-containing protein [Candidatus Micrarchaeota archaeon]|nr:DUF655 domain-containing protein [Candidatus Micrarchaeota archaeon]
MEEFAYVLDIVPFGDREGTAVYLIGLKYTLLKAKAKEKVPIKIGQRTYVGKDLEKREIVEKIRGRVDYDNLSEGARQNLKDVLKLIVKEKEKEFVEFLNKAKAISVRTHQLDFIPYVGKKTKKAILAEREKRPFESFEDVKARTGMDPVEAFAEKLYREISGRDVVKFFVVRF